jgi:hypothetical protein
MIELIKKLHSFNVIHGDAHLGNFATRLRNPDELMFIDFGRAKYVGAQDIEKAKNNGGKFRSNKEFFHPFIGKWERQDCKPAFRDDVYRAVATTAIIIHGSAHIKYLKVLPHFSKDLIKQIKDTGNLLNLPQLRYKDSVENAYVLEELLVEKVSGISGGRLGEIQKHLGIISALAVHEDPQDPYHKPDYDLIIDEFQI